LFAAELDDFAEEADGLVGEGFEVGGGDAGGCFRHDEMVAGWGLRWEVVEVDRQIIYERYIIGDECTQKGRARKEDTRTRIHVTACSGLINSYYALT